MLKFCSLYSSSTGNSLLVQSENTNIIVDAGVSGKKIIEALSSVDVCIESIQAIIVTHEHTDHTLSLATLSKKYNIPIYANDKTWSVLKQDKIASCNKKLFTPYESFEIGDLEILPFRIPHDAIDPCGFNISNNGTKISIATDLGYIDSKIFSHLKNSSFVLLESNYDPEVLKCCSYPFSLKQRISGPTGHLSNNSAGQVICELYNHGLKSAMLGHLSKESNFPELAYHTVADALQSNNISKDNLCLKVASRLEPSELLCIEA